MVKAQTWRVGMISCLLLVFMLLVAVGLGSQTLTFAGIDAGTRIPSDLVAHNQNGQEVSLNSYHGQWLVLYFYPKDDTPGCTKQACALRDNYKKFRDEGIVIFGVSKQDAESHRDFKAKYHLPFDLLTDEKGGLGKTFGVSSIPLIGIYKRQSVLISPDGTVARFFETVNPESHDRIILETVRDFRKATHGARPSPSPAP